MSINAYFQKKKCRDLEYNHKKAVYETSKRKFKKLNEFISKLQLLFPNETISADDEVCDYCYAKLLKLIPESDSSSQKNSEDSPCLLSQATSSSSIHSGIISDHSFVPEVDSEDFQKLNEELGLHSSVISPLKHVKEIDPRRRVIYAARKRKEILEMNDSQLVPKIKKLYDIAENEKIDFLELSSSNCISCKDWFKNFCNSLSNCSSFAEKIRLLTAAPICEIPKNILLSEWPDVTDYMIRKARAIVNEKGNYCTSDPYCGHPIDEKVKNLALQYYLNDDLNCSTQSPNKRDTIRVYENGEKIVKVKRFMLRSINETYKLFKRDNPHLKIGHSKFYSLRPKWVIQSPTQQVCLCIYCTNFELLVVSLKNCLSRLGIEVMDIRETILSAAVCSIENDACIFKECKKCPGAEGIVKVLSDLISEEMQEDFTFAIWEGNDLIKKTTSVEIFMRTSAEWTLKVNTHLHCKKIQQEGIKLEKEIAEKNDAHLVLHIDFAENWSVIVRNEIQSYHWKTKQVSIFTAVCYFAQNIESYVVVTDDLSHDSAHALLAIEKIVNNLNIRFSEVHFQKMTIISDGAASHFKNRFQLNELKSCKIEKKWIFSTTGHGKGACDGIGGLVKHFASKHNLSVDPTNYIQCAEVFVKEVQKKTPKIKHVLLDEQELAIFREKKTKSWKKIPAYKGIRDTHVWKNELSSSKTIVLTARTCIHEWKTV